MFKKLTLILCLVSCVEALGMRKSDQLNLWLTKAQIAINSNQLKTAEGFLQKIIVQSPKHIAAISLLASVYTQGQKFLKARGLYRKILRQNLSKDEKRTIKLSIASLNIQQNMKIRETLQFLKALEKIEKFELTANYLLGLINIQKGQAYKALSHWKQIQNSAEDWKKPDRDQFFILLANVYLELGEVEMAQFYLKKLGKEASRMSSNIRSQVSRYLNILERNSGFYISSSLAHEFNSNVSSEAQNEAEENTTSPRHGQTNLVDLYLSYLSSRSRPLSVEIFSTLNSVKQFDTRFRAFDSLSYGLGTSIYYRGLHKHLLRGFFHYNQVHTQQALNSDNPTHFQLENFSYGHSLGLEWTQYLSLGKLSLRPSFGYNVFNQTKDTNYRDYSISVGMTPWPTNRWLAPSFSLQYGHESAFLHTASRSYLSLSMSNFSHISSYSFLSNQLALLQYKNALTEYDEYSVQWTSRHILSLEKLALGLVLDTTFSYRRELIESSDHLDIDVFKLRVGLGYSI